MNNSSIELAYIPIDKMAADGLTKPLPGPKHQAFISQLGMEDWKKDWAQIFPVKFAQDRRGVLKSDGP